MKSWHKKTALLLVFCPVLALNVTCGQGSVRNAAVAGAFYPGSKDALPTKEALETVSVTVSLAMAASLTVPL